MLSWKHGLTVASLVGLISFSGCDKPASAPQTSSPKASATHDESKPHDHGEGSHEHKDEAGGHGHGAGPHEGTLADWGGGKYHVEFTVDHDKKEATVYILGSDEKSATPIKAAEGKILLAITEPAFQVELKAAPLDGEKDGLSSKFVGQHEKLGTVREFAGTISGEIDGTPYAADFKEEPHGDHDHK